MTAEISIDSEGIIRSAGAESAALWRMKREELEGRFFPELFVLEIRPQSEEDRAIHWEVLREAAEAEPLPLEAQPASGEPFPVEILLRRHGDDGFTATLQVPDSANGASQEADGTRGVGSAGQEIIAEQGPAAEPEAGPSHSSEVLPHGNHSACGGISAGPDASSEKQPPGLEGQRDGDAAAPAECRTKDESAGAGDLSGRIEAPSAGPDWSLLLQQPHLGFFELDFERQQFFFSPAWKTMLGFGENELPDRHETLIKLIHPEDSDAAPDRSAHRRPGETLPFSMEYRLRHKSGGYVWVQAVGAQQFDANGELSRVTGFHLDIQERKEIEDETQRNEERFLALLHRGKLAFFDLDFRSGEAFFSPAWLDNLGYNETEIPALPESFKRLLDPSTFSEEFYSLFQDEKEGRDIFAREFRFQRKDGSFVNLLLRIIRVCSRRGELVRVIGLESQGEDALGDGVQAALADMLVEGISAAHEAIVLTNPDSRVVFANRKAEELAGIDGEAARGEDLGTVLPLHQKGGGQPAGNIADEVLASGSAIAFSQEFLLRSPGGDEREIVLSCDPVRDPNGRILGTVLVFRDPLEMSLTPEELVRSNRLESLGLVAGGIAHDFNNLLTTILGGISLARETHEWEPLQNSEEGCVSAKNLTRQLLGFARGRQAGRKAMRVNSLIRDCLRMATAGSRIPTETDLPDDLYPAVLDASQIGQVFQNLFVNAVQAMAVTEQPALRITGCNVTLPDGKVRGLDEGDYLQITIEDTGPGIPPEALEKIFQPFFTTKKTGTGLGLSTVHSIVRQHGGQITVTSKVGEGTTFTLYFPKTAEVQEKAVRRAPSLKYGSGRILFMDDDEEITSLASGMLQRLDYQHDIARNGEEAIALYRRYLNVGRPYDAVILDLTIVGGMGGEETLQTLLELDPDVRAIVSSGYNSEETNEYYLSHGFYGVLSKPYRSEELGKVLRQVLGRE